MIELEGFSSAAPVADDKFDDDFDQFNSAAEPVTGLDPSPPATHEQLNFVEEVDDFADFVAPTGPPALSKPFEENPSPISQPTVSPSPSESFDDDFGDFGAPQPVPSAVEEVVQSRPASGSVFDDFGQEDLFSFRPSVTSLDGFDAVAPTAPSVLEIRQLLDRYEQLIEQYEATLAPPLVQKSPPSQATAAPAATASKVVIDDGDDDFDEFSQF